jgi:hypothetical protein
MDVDQANDGSLMKSKPGDELVFSNTTAKSLNAFSDCSLRQQHKDGSFKTDVRGDRQTRDSIQFNMAQRQCFSSNEKGIVVLLEDESITVYAANDLMDKEVSHKGFGKSKEAKDPSVKKSGAGIDIIDTYKPTFVPISARFNPA